MDENIVYELLKELREDQKKHGQELAKQSVSLENVEEDLSEIKKTVAQNTEDVAEHIHRTNLLEENQLDNAEKIDRNSIRIDSLEEPVKAKAWFKKNYLSMVSIITAMLSLIALISKISGLW